MYMFINSPCIYTSRYFRRCHVEMCSPYFCAPHPYNNAYKFRITCIAMYSISMSVLICSSAYTIKPSVRQFVTLKIDVGVQSWREVDIVWLAQTCSIAGVWEHTKIGWAHLDMTADLWYITEAESDISLSHWQSHFTGDLWYGILPYTLKASL